MLSQSCVRPSCMRKTTSRHAIRCWRQGQQWGMWMWQSTWRVSSFVKGDMKKPSRCGAHGVDCCCGIIATIRGVYMPTTCKKPGLLVQIVFPHTPPHTHAFTHPPSHTHTFTHPPSHTHTFPHTLHHTHMYSPTLHHTHMYSPTLHSTPPHTPQAFSEIISSHGPSPDLTYNIALCHFRQKQYAAALKLAADIITQGVRQHPELGVGSATGGVSVRSVGNSQLLRSTALIEAFNLKVCYGVVVVLVWVCCYGLRGPPPCVGVSMVVDCVGVSMVVDCVCML